MVSMRVLKRKIHKTKTQRDEMTDFLNLGIDLRGALSGFTERRDQLSQELANLRAQKKRREGKSRKRR